MHLVIVRTVANVLDLNTYNCQELGLAKALTKKGLKVSLIMAGYENKAEKYSCEGGFVEVHFLKFNAIDQRFGYFCGIYKKLQELDPSHIQVHDLGIFMTWYVVRWAKKNRIPCFLIQGTYQTSPRYCVKQIETLFCSSFGKYTLKNVAGVGCKTIMASRFINSYLKRETRLTYIGLDDNKFKNPLEKNWIKELHLEGKKILLYIGIMEERRRPHFLLDVIKNLPQDYVLLLVGKGPQWDELKKRIEQENLKEKVYLLGKLEQKQLPSLYDQSDLFLLASRYEIYGMVLLESMYFGLPVVSSYTAGSETIIEQWKNGVIISDFNINKWTRNIMDLCEDNERLLTMRIAAKAKITNELIWDKAVESFLKLYGINNSKNIRE